MKHGQLSPYDQQDYVRRIQVGWKAANDDQAASARVRGEAERGLVADELQQMSDDLRRSQHQSRLGEASSGLVEQQRLFMKLVECESGLRNVASNEVPGGKSGKVWSSLLVRRRT